jgi:tRNA(Ile)-lysidine synthase
MLDRRLAHDDAAPILVALSGGGDSLALLLAALAWSRGAGRGIVAATVDHRLAAESGAWAAACRRRCEALGVPHVTLAWEGPRPAAGLAAAARAARHRLLASAARAVGARVMLVGHTADDVIEAALMREAGAWVAAPRAWSPSPVWPEGRDLFLLRPLLGVRRAALRGALAGLGERWIEDPANADLASPRSRARALIAAGRPAPPAPACAVPRRTPFRAGAAGEAWADRDALRAAPPPEARAGRGAALGGAAGAERPARGGALDRLSEALRSTTPVAATLAGARVCADGGRVVIAREIEDRRDRRPRQMVLGAGETAVWDGRYELRNDGAERAVTPLAGRLSRLPKHQQARARRLHPLARSALPALIGSDGAVSCPVLDDSPGVAVRSLVSARLAAACGDIDHERAIVAWRTQGSDPKSDGMSGKRPADEPS